MSSISKGLFPDWLRQSIGPLFLMISTPLTVLLMVHTQLNLDGSFLNLWGELKQDAIGTISKSWVTPSSKAWQYLLIFAAFELIIMRVVPGKTFKGPITAKTGHQPIYKANGFQCYLLTLATFVVCGFGFKLFDPATVYDLYQEMICAVMQAGLALVVLLYIKGSIPALRSPGDHGTSGNSERDAGEGEQWGERGESSAGSIDLSPASPSLLRKWTCRDSTFPFITTALQNRSHQSHMLCCPPLPLLPPLLPPCSLHGPVLGQGALPPHCRLGHQDVHQLPLWHDDLGPAAHCLCSKEHAAAP